MVIGNACHGLARLPFGDVYLPCMHFTSALCSGGGGSGGRFIISSHVARLVFHNRASLTVHYWFFSHSYHFVVVVEQPTQPSGCHVKKNKRQLIISPVVVVVVNSMQRSSVQFRSFINSSSSDSPHALCRRKIPSFIHSFSNSLSPRNKPLLMF